MTLTDTGPLVALIDRNDESHTVCSRALSQIQLPLVTTVSVITESMYLLYGRAGWKGQKGLFALIGSHSVKIEDAETRLVLRMEELMAKYADTPMDYADAALVALAEERKLRRIFTLDNDFRVYQLFGREPFVVIPN